LLSKLCILRQDFDVFIYYQFSSLLLGLTQKSPDEWRQEGKKDVRDMKQTWSLRTHDGQTRADGREEPNCQSWREAFNITAYRYNQLSLSSGDIIAITFTTDRSMSLTYRGRDFIIHTDLPDQPLYVVIGMMVKKLEVKQTGQFLHYYDVLSSCRFF